MILIFQLLMEEIMRLREEFGSREDKEHQLSIFIRESGIPVRSAVILIDGIEYETDEDGEVLYDFLDGKLGKKVVIKPQEGGMLYSLKPSKIKLGTGITLVPERNPLLLAKEIATLDRYSGGRFQFGIGTGWLKEETELMGGDFEHRWTQTREAIEVMKELWTKEEAEYHGRYFDFPLVKSYPKPVQTPHPPVILGGMAKNVLRRVVACADGWLPNRVTPAEVEESRKKLDAMSAEAGRDPKSITISVYGQLPEHDIVHSLLNAGADRVVVRPEHVETEKAMGEQLERMAEAVLR